MADTSIRNENISNTNKNIYITSISLVDFLKYLSVLLFFIFRLQGRIVISPYQLFEILKVNGWYFYSERSSIIR